MSKQMKWERAKPKKKTLNLQYEFKFRDRADRWLFRCFTRQRASAKQRGIPFAMEFDEWLGVWRRSGHLRQRGTMSGNYVMGRHGDVGPYTSSNVSIISIQENTRLAAQNRKLRRQALTGASTGWITASSSQVPF